MGNPASFNREPLWWIAAGQGIIQAIFVLLSSFNVQINSTQQAAITGLFIVIGTALGRSKVYAPVDASGQPLMLKPVVKPPPPYDELAQMIAENEAFAKRLNAKK